MNSTYDVVVLGGTPAGIAAALHAARDDHETRLVTYNDTLGGMMASGLSMTDTILHPRKGRSPVLDEFFQRVRTHYRTSYGPDSAQFEICNDGLVFEPHVASDTFASLVDDESTLSVTRRWYPTAVERDGRRLRSVTLESFDGTSTRQIEGDVFVDATYEGDLAAAAGVPYRLGRESRDEYGERFAGRVFTDADDIASIRPGSTGAGDDAIQAYNYRLCLSRDPENRRRPEKPDGYDRREYLWILDDREEMRDRLADENVDDPMSVGLDSRTSTALATAMARWYETGGQRAAVDDADRWVPLTSDVYRDADPVETGLLPLPAETSLLNRSATGIAAGLFEQDGEGFVWGELPNDKRDLNACDLVGESHGYPEADWPTRRAIAKRHLDYVLGFLYFVQNDDAVPDEVRAMAREWGLAADEFVDDDNLPFQLYVREARRIEGRATFTEHDAFLAPGLDRAPVADDAVAIAEFPLDPHDVRAVRRPGTAADGRFFLTEATVPSQIPYGSLLPESLDNLLVPVALSASHVGFQTIRLEPTWTQLGEAAGVAAGRALRTDTAPGELEVSALQYDLAERRSMISFFADVAVANDEPWIPAVQFLGTKGFFDSYQARPSAPLDERTARAWARTTAAVLEEGLGATQRARALPKPEDLSDSTPVGSSAFVSSIDRELDRSGRTVDAEAAASSRGLSDEPSLTRGDAARIVYGALIDRFVDPA